MKYDHYIALDWAQSNMAIAWQSGVQEERVVDIPASLPDLKIFLARLKGTKIMTFEETNTAQWLFAELYGLVDEIIACDTYRNKLLSEGGKSDKVDALKLLKLLKAGLLKPVFHAKDNHFVELRRLVSSYEDIIKIGVRLKNQRAAIFRARGIGKDQTVDPQEGVESFVVSGLDKLVSFYEDERKRYVKEFERLSKTYKTISHIASVPGIGVVSAVKVAATVVDAHRFPSRNDFYSYCGLIKHERMSGGRSYGKKAPRYSRTMKAVFKSAAMTVLTNITKHNVFKDYYLHLCTSKNYAVHNARHAVARRVAAIVYGVMKSGKRFDPERMAQVLSAKDTPLTVQNNL